MNDLRVAFRELLKNHGLSAVAILSLALGVGANTTISSLLNGPLLTPMSGRDPSRALETVSSNPIEQFQNGGLLDPT